MTIDLRDLNSIPDPLPESLANRALADRVLADRALATPAARPVPVIPPGYAGPTRASLRNRKLVALGVGLGWMLLTPMLWGYRKDIPLAQLLLHIALPSALGMAALVFALSPGKAGLGPQLKSALGLGVLAPLLFVVAALSTPCFESASSVAWSSFLCGDVVVLLALVPLGMLAWAQRRTVVSGAAWRSALAGGAIGLVAAGFQGLHCVHTDGVHVALGHGWPVVVLGALGGTLLQRVARVA